jgi:hypothetical protein
MPMNWTGVGKHYGLQRPFDFRIAIPFLLNILALILLMIVCAFLFADGGLSIGTQRFQFLAYIVVLLMLAAAFSRNDVLSLAAFSWCVLELVLALSASTLARYGIDTGTVVFPQNYFTPPPTRGFVYHPLLQNVPKRNWEVTINYDRYRGFLSNYPINWAALSGREFTFSHNSLGIRGIEPTADDLEKNLIFIYGGSSTYDVTVTQGETWVEHLQSALNDKYTVLNFGVPSYSTTEHLIQTAFYQEVREQRPVCAIYYVGWNDIHNAHRENLDRAYADWHLLITVNFNRRPEIWLARYSPLLRLAYRKAEQRIDTIPELPMLHGKKPAIANARDKRLESIFVEHVSAIIAINNSRGIKTVFIGQILNRNVQQFGPEDVSFWFPTIRNRDIWPLQERFNVVLRDAAALNGAKYIDAGIENFSDSDFSDNGHFTAAGSRKFSGLISTRVEKYCQ